MYVGLVARVGVEGHVLAAHAGGSARSLQCGGAPVKYSTITLINIITK